MSGYYGGGGASVANEDFANTMDAADSTARLALTYGTADGEVQLGDIVRQVDTGAFYLLIGSTPSNSAHWQQLSALPASIIASGQLALARGGTGADLSATGGTGQVLKQASAGGVVTVGALTASEMPSGIDAAKIGAGSVSNTEFGYLDGVTSALQGQLDGKAASSHTHSQSDITGLVALLATLAPFSGTRTANTLTRWDASGNLVNSGLIEAAGTSGTYGVLVTGVQALRFGEDSTYPYVHNGATTNCLYHDADMFIWRLQNGTSLGNMQSAGLGVGTGLTAAARKLEVVDSTAAQQRWTHTASTKYAERQVDTNGYVYETATGNRWHLAYLSDTTKNLGIIVNSGGQAYLRASGTEIYLETDGGTNVVQIIGNAAGLTKLSFGRGFWLKGGSSSPSLLDAGTGQYVGLRDGSGYLRLAVDSTGIGFHGSTPVAKQTLPTALTDSTGGSASDTLAAITTTGITDTVAQDAIIALKNAVASLAAKINGQRTTFIATTLVS